MIWSWAAWHSKSFRVWRPLTRIVEDPAADQGCGTDGKESRDVFKKLRDALSIAVAQTQKGLNDDGGQVSIKSIEKKVTQFRRQMIPAQRRLSEDDRADRQVLG